MQWICKYHTYLHNIYSVYSSSSAPAKINGSVYYTHIRADDAGNALTVRGTALHSHSAAVTRGNIYWLYLTHHHNEQEHILNKYVL